MSARCLHIPRSNLGSTAFTVSRQIPRIARLSSVMEMSLRSGIGFIELIVDAPIEQEMDPYKCTTGR